MHPTEVCFGIGLCNEVTDTLACVVLNVLFKPASKSIQHLIVSGGRGSTKRWEEEDDEDDDSELQQFAVPEQRQRKLGGHSETSSLHHEEDEESQGRGGGYNSGSDYLPVKRHCQESTCSLLEIGELDTGGRGSPMSRPTPDASAIGKKWIAMVGSPTTRLDALAGACRKGGMDSV